MNVVSQGPLVPDWACGWHSRKDGRRCVWRGHRGHWWHVLWAVVSPPSPLTGLTVCDTASGTCCPCWHPSAHRIWSSEGLWTGEREEWTSDETPRKTWFGLMSIINVKTPKTAHKHISYTDGWFLSAVLLDYYISKMQNRSEHLKYISLKTVLKTWRETRLHQHSWKNNRRTMLLINKNIFVNICHLADWRFCVFLPCQRSRPHPRSLSHHPNVCN